MVTHQFVGGAIEGKTITFPEAELRHIRARRIRPGETILVRAQDKTFICKMADDLHRAFIMSTLNNKSKSSKICIAAAFPKGKRKHFLVEKLTEIGVATIIPLAAARNSFKPSEKQLEKLRRVSLEASKQSHGNPAHIEPVMTLEEFSLAARDYDAKLLLDPDNGTTISYAARGKTSAVCAIGPEGGFTGDEAGLLKTHGFTAVSLMTNILRIETCCVYASAVLSEVLERRSDKQE